MYITTGTTCTRLYWEYTWYSTAHKSSKKNEDNINFKLTVLSMVLCADMYHLTCLKRRVLYACYYTTQAMIILGP